MASCGKETEGATAATEVTAPKEYLNITLLLDLSERISPSLKPQQAQRDLNTINALLEVFEKNQKKHLFIKSKDKLTVAVPRQRSSDYSASEFGDKLTIDMTAKGMNKPKFDERKKEFLSSINGLYAQATKSKTSGADIWGWFRDDVSAAIKKSNQDNIVYRNKLIILTDGYMDIDAALAIRRPEGTYMDYRDIQQLRNKSNWRDIFEKKNMRLTPHPGVDYGNLEVLVLEVDPKDPTINTNELEIIKTYWGTWLEQIKPELHPQQDNPQATKDIIENFLLRS